jgi:hypothetical protein
LAKVAIQCSADKWLLFKHWFSASTFEAETATFTKGETVMVQLLVQYEIEL